MENEGYERGGLYGDGRPKEIPEEKGGEAGKLAAKGYWVAGGSTRAGENAHIRLFGGRGGRKK